MPSGTAECLTGKTFGAIEVFDRDTTSNDKHPRYFIKCTVCGSEMSMRADNIRRSPDHCKFCKYNDITGRQFGLLTAVNLSDKQDAAGHRYWVCKCQCGNTKEILATNLLRGLTTTCGCERYRNVSEKESIDITGEKFGKLTAIKKVSDLGERSTWECRCDCGGVTYATSANLRNGHTQSCGCIKSLGELSVRKELDKNRIPYVTECRFEELPNRRFDFAIIDKESVLKYLIEFDGVQHYKFSPGFHKTNEDYIASIARDTEKDMFCYHNDIPLYRIRYDDNVALRIKEIIQDKKVAASAYTVDKARRLAIGVT